MSATATSSIAQASSPRPPAALKLERLALLYEGILTAIVRVQAGRQQVQDLESFRSRMKQALREIADTAARRGYVQEDVQEANFAVIAFLDEAVLTSQDDGRTQWARKSLGEEMFDQRSAGEVFFKRLESLRAHRDSPQLAEVLEVYYLCLLLGYEGQYAGGSRVELQLLMTNMRDRIERIFGRYPEFSPDASLPDAPLPQVVADPLVRQLTITAAAAVVFAFLCFFIFWLHLQSKSSDLERMILEHAAVSGGQG